MKRTKDIVQVREGQNINRIQQNRERNREHLHQL